MNSDQQIALIEEALRRAADAIRRRDPDALAGRFPAHKTNRGDPVTPKAEKCAEEKP